MVSELFKGLSQEEINKFIETSAIIKNYKKNENIFIVGEEAKYLYILIEGQVIVESIDKSGKQIIVNKFTKSGDIFAEVYSILRKKFEYNAYAKISSKILLIDNKKINNFSDAITTKIFLNLNYLLAKRAYKLNQKLMIISSFTLREKIMNYLYQNQDKGELNLDFTLEELAAFLGVTRPGLSREISNMEKEGLIEKKGKKIKIKNFKAQY